MLLLGCATEKEVQPSECHAYSRMQFRLYCTVRATVLQADYYMQRWVVVGTNGDKMEFESAIVTVEEVP